MKVKLLIAVNIGGKQYPAGVEADLKPKDAQALIRGRYAIAVKERAVPKVVVEKRQTPVVAPVGEVENSAN